MANFEMLATGAGAAEGLEELFARMRAEEALSNQSRALDIDERQGSELSRYRSDELGLRRDEQAALRPGREADARLTNANADVTSGQAEVLKGLRSIATGQPGASAEMGSSSIASPAVVGGDPTALNNPLGRLRLRLAGIPPNDMFGAVDTPNTEWETEMNAYAVKLGKRSYKDLTWDEIQAARTDPMADDRLRMAAERLEVSKGQLDLSRDRLGFQQEQAAQRQAMAAARFEQELPSHLRAMATAEYNDRIKREIGSDDPPAKYDSIRDEIVAKYKTPVAPGSTSGVPAPGAPRRGRYNPATGQIEY